MAKRLTNLRRKCDGFILQTGYGRGIDNTTDAISRIKDWSGNDPDRLESAENSRDIDNDSNKVSLTECINNSDLENIIMEVNSMDIENKASVTSHSGLQGGIRLVRISLF